MKIRSQGQMRGALIGLTAILTGCNGSAPGADYCDRNPQDAVYCGDDAGGAFYVEQALRLVQEDGHLPDDAFLLAVASPLGNNPTRVRFCDSWISDFAR